MDAPIPACSVFPVIAVTRRLTPRLSRRSMLPAAAWMKQICVLPEFAVAAARCGADFAGEQAGLFPGGEVAAAAGLVPVHDVGEAALGPAARGPGHLLGEDAAAGRDGDGVGGGGGEPLGDLGDALPVQPG